MKIEDLIKKADKFNREEIKKYNSDIEDLYDFALEKGIMLAQKYNADVDVVKIAIAMMDSKIPEASFLKTPAAHKDMAVEATKKFLEDADALTEKQKENIIKCVEEHHGAEKFYSIESEVVCNADCYKFIHPKGVFSYLSILARRVNNFSEELAQLEKKMNEKHNLISLPSVKEELEPYYKKYSMLLSIAKKGE